MSRILVVGEDPLCAALGERLIASALPSWQLAGPSIPSRSFSDLVPKLSRYAGLARDLHPVLCIADSDRKCPVELVRDHRPMWAPDRFVFRLVVSEAESWVLADRECFAAAFEVPLARVPRNVDGLSDVKEQLLSLVRASRVRRYREEIVSESSCPRPGHGYNLHLCAFVREQWSAQRARHASPSLDRAVSRLQALGEAPA